MLSVSRSRNNARAASAAIAKPRSYLPKGLYAAKRGRLPPIGVARRVVPFDAAVEQEAEPVVVEVAESVSDSFDLLGQLDRFGRAVGDAGCVEVGQQLGPPGVDGAGRSGQFWDVGAGAIVQPPAERVGSAGPVRAVEDQA